MRRRRHATRAGLESSVVARPVKQGCKKQPFFRGHYAGLYIEGYRDESIRSLVKPLRLCVRGKSSLVPVAIVSHKCKKNTAENFLL